MEKDVTEAEDAPVVLETLLFRLVPFWIAIY